MSNKQSVIVPELEHDAMMRERFQVVVSANGRMERRIVANLCAHLINKGFMIFAVWDGDDMTQVWEDKNPTTAAMELIFNLDEVSLRIRKSVKSAEHGILLMLGEGDTIITDWSYSQGDADGFNAAMDEFNAEDYA